MQNVFTNNNKDMIKIRFETLDHIKEFINVTEKLEGDVLIYSGHYVVDGRSLMGILSLSLADILEVRIVNQKERKKFLDKVKELGILITKENDE